MTTGSAATHLRPEQTRENLRPFRLLFVCTGNACRSAMAEGLARHYGMGRPCRQRLAEN